MNELIVGMCWKDRHTPQTYSLTHSTSQTNKMNEPHYNIGIKYFSTLYAIFVEHAFAHVYVHTSKQAGAIQAH